MLCEGALIIIYFVHINQEAIVCSRVLLPVRKTLEEQGENKSRVIVPLQMEALPTVAQIQDRNQIEV